jgi:hypothetical protein
VVFIDQALRKAARLFVKDPPQSLNQVVATQMRLYSKSPPEKNQKVYMLYKRLPIIVRVLLEEYLRID